MTRKIVNVKVRDNGGNFFVSAYRSLTLGLQNFLRNKLLSIATIIVISVIIFIFNIILAIQFLGNQTLQTLSEKVDILINLRNDIDFYDANRIVEEIKKIEGVKQVKYTSKEEALEIVSKTHPKTAEFLQKFNIGNPLPPSISITTENIEYYAHIQQSLETDEFKGLMQNYVTKESGGQQILSSIAKNLANISHLVKQLIFWIVFIFVIGGTLVMVNAIQLTIYARRQEIYIMRLVGAIPNFIRAPFIFEGILYGILAVILSFIILFVIGNSIPIEEINLWSYYANIGNSIPLQETNLWSYYANIDFASIFIYEMAITVIMAGTSSFVAVQQYLKGKLTVN